MKRLLIIPLLSACGIAPAQDSLTVTDRIFTYPAAVSEAVDLSFMNPALRPFQHAVSLSAVGVEGGSSRMSEAVDPCKGDGNDYWSAGVQTYMHHKNATIWGDASYTNGTQRGIKYNETSDPELIYPYFCADTIGGDLRMETYRLCGGYASQTGRLMWGVRLSYDAGIYYRDVDPRPKNVTGLLDFSIGIAMKFDDDYSAGISVGAKKYSQTCDIMWMSEAGKTEIYHPTGLGNKYNRFTGSSESSHYDGTTFAATATLYPINNQGFVATVHLSHYQFKKTLTDLNKLPLCSAWHNTMLLQAGYMTESWALAADAQFDRRHGSENIFGDALSGVYPQIGSLPMYADNRWRAGVRGAYTFGCGRSTVIDINASSGMAHRQQLYAQPAMEECDDVAYAFLSGVCRHRFEKGWNLEVQLAAARASKHFSALYPKVKAYKALTRAYALGLSIGYARTWHHGGITGHMLQGSLNMIF